MRDGEDAGTGQYGGKNEKYTMSTAVAIKQDVSRQKEREK